MLALRCVYPYFSSCSLSVISYPIKSGNSELLGRFDCEPLQQSFVRQDLGLLGSSGEAGSAQETRPYPGNFTGTYSDYSKIFRTNRDSGNSRCWRLTWNCFGTTEKPGLRRWNNKKNCWKRRKIDRWSWVLQPFSLLICLLLFVAPFIQ